MKRLLSNLKAFAAVLAIGAILSGCAARAADLSEPVILVASSPLDDTPFEQAVVLATPLPDGSHIGFIINKPTGVTLKEVLPDDQAAGKVEESVYLGGPVLLPSVFAITSKPPESADDAIPLMRGLFVVVDRDAIDRILATTPNDARFFLGMMVWKPDALEEEVRQRFWEIRQADAEAVLHAKSAGLWKLLRGSGPYI